MLLGKPVALLFLYVIEAEWYHPEVYNPPNNTMTWDSMIDARDHGEHVQKTAENTVNMGPSQRDALEEQMTRKRPG